MKAKAKKLIAKAWLGCALLAGSIGVANAIPVLSVVPSSDLVIKGGAPTRVDVMVSGLDSEFIGAYDLNLTWDAPLLSLTNVSFDSFLDGPADSFFGSTPALGSVNVFEISVGGLTNQLGLSEFRLFSLDFTGLDFGFASISIAGGILFNDAGDRYQAWESRGARLEVVPEPATLGLLLMGIAGAVAGRRTRKTVEPVSA